MTMCKYRTSYIPNSRHLTNNAPVWEQWLWYCTWCDCCHPDICEMSYATIWQMYMLSPAVLVLLHCFLLLFLLI